MIGTRDADKPELRKWLSGDGAGIEAGTFAETAEHGELLVLAVLGDAAEQAIAEAGPTNFSGKVVIDTMNPLDFSAGFPPKLSISGEDSLGERVQRALPDAKVVKAFNTIGNPYFVDPSFSEGQPTMLIAGDDADASAPSATRWPTSAGPTRSTSAASRARARDLSICKVGPAIRGCCCYAASCWRHWRHPRK
jgi:predicted dinucleotide-binding enzyme